MYDLKTTRSSCIVGLSESILEKDVLSYNLGNKRYLESKKMDILNTTASLTIVHDIQKCQTGPCNEDNPLSDSSGY